MLANPSACRRPAGDRPNEHPISVQNILVFRFANSMVERAWCGEVVDHVQITVAESSGIDRRGRYYEEAGALRDMVQNHLLQVLSFVAMEPPASLAPEDVRDRKAELLEAVHPFRADELVSGQYAAGVVRAASRGYREEERVAPDSTVETFIALRACCSRRCEPSLVSVARTCCVVTTSARSPSSQPFSTRELASLLGCSVQLAQRTAYCLRAINIIEAGGKRGRTPLHRRISPAAR